MSMPFDGPEIYDPPILFLTDWLDEDFLSSSIFEGHDRKAGDVWKDEDGYHAVTLSNTGEGAHMKGERLIREFVRKEQT